MPRPTDNGSDTSELQKVAAPAFAVGLGMLIVGVVAPALPFAAGIAGAALETGKWLTLTFGGGYGATRFGLKAIDAIKGTATPKPKKKETLNPAE